MQPALERLNGICVIGMFCFCMLTPGIARSENLASLNGAYSGQEFYTVKINLGFDTETEKGNTIFTQVEFDQTGSTFTCSALVNDNVVTWNGTLKENKITSFWGPAIAGHVGDSSFTENRVTSATGIVQDGVITVTTHGVAKGRIFGLTGRMDVTSTLTFTGPAVPAPDILVPTIRVTTPVKGQRYIGQALTVKGTAADNVKVSRVYYQLNSGGWLPAFGNTNWQIDVYPAPGTNTVSVYAVDSAGNCSLTNQVTFFQSVLTPLTLVTNGQGTISRKFSGNLEIGKSFTATAVPKSTNWMFAGWSGDVTSPDQTLNFVMRSNLTIVANFTNNAFLSRCGNYNGLVHEDVARPESSGNFNLTVTPKGSFSGKVYLAGVGYSVSGQFNANGESSAAITRRGKSPVQVKWSMDLTNATDSVSLSLWTTNWTATGSGELAAIGSTKVPVPYAGRYTWIIPGGRDLAVSPAGDGCGTIVVAATGKVSLSGTLADGTAITVNSAISKSGQWPLYYSLQSGSGMVLSWITLTNAALPHPTNDTVWIKSQTKGGLYPAGFTNETTFIWSPYTPPAKLTRVLSVAEGKVTWSGGNLIAPANGQWTLQPANTLTVSGHTNTTMRIDVTKGTVTGSFWHPDLKKKLTLTGALLQDQNVARGFFLGTNQSGAFLMQSN